MTTTTTTTEVAPPPPPLMLVYTTFRTITDKETHQVQSTWPELVEKLTHPQDYASKKDCPLLKLATFGNELSPKGSLRHTQNMAAVTGIEADYDGERVSIEQAAQLLTDAAIAAMLYTSPSHTPERPRWRVLAPLSQAHTVAERRRFVGMLNTVLGGILAPESFTDAQTFFYGRVTGCNYQAVQVQGFYIDADTHSSIEPTYPIGRTTRATAGGSLPTAAPPDDLDRAIVLNQVTPQTLDDLKSALGVNPATGAPWIDPDDRGVWVAVAHAIKCLGEPGFELWSAWSASSEKWEDGHDDPRAIWDSCRGNIADYRAVFAKAQAAGWVNPRSAQGLAASTPPTLQHPLNRFVDFDGVVKPPRWVIPGFICADGVVSIAGAPGVGKTTALLPLAMTAAGLHGGELMPEQWRHVIYITEDTEQAKRIMAGITRFATPSIPPEQVRERFRLVDAVRLDPVYVATVGTAYREQFTRTVEGVDVLPLVVIDTKSAVLALENENDNAEASRMMAALKQGFAGLPIWLIGHTAKADKNNTDAEGLSSRGAGAVGGDGNQTLFLIREGERRYLVPGKKRFETKWPELEITSHTAETPALDEFGNVENVVMRWGIAAPPQQGRGKASKQAAGQQRQQDEASLRQSILSAVETAWQAGVPLNRRGVRNAVPRSTAATAATVETLIEAGWLYEVTIPKDERTNPNKKTYLVTLTPDERDSAALGIPPTAKLTITKSRQFTRMHPPYFEDGRDLV